MAGLSAVIPVIHGLFLYGHKQMEQQMGLSWVILQGVAYISGAGLYAVNDSTNRPNVSLTVLQARLPERLNPGRYDVLGSSHQIFHILVVVAAVSHLAGLLKAFDYRHGTAMQSCP